MSLVSPHSLFNHCYGKYALAAVNVFTMEQVHSVFRAAEAAVSPIIIQITPAARNYAHPQMLAAMVTAAANIYPDVIYCLHLDHGIESHIFEAIHSGYTSVMIDASHDDFQTNISRTRAIVNEASKMDVFVEAELGVLSGVEDDTSIDESRALYTDPDQAKLFVRETGCNSLAVAVGTSHGAYKFSGSKGIQFDILGKIQAELPGFPLVLHGSSRVKKEEIELINQYGGELLSNASGVSDADIRKAIGFGICKVNLATDLRLLWTRVHRKFFWEQPQQFDPVIPGKEYIEACTNYLIERFEILGSAGMSDQLKNSQR